MSGWVSPFAGKTLLNISSAVVHAKPGTTEVVRALLMTIEGVEIHAISEDGKLIVTIEADGDRATADTYGSIGQMDNVMSVAMVYHQTESDPDKEL